MLTCGDREVGTRVRSERNQGRADDMDWLSHDRLGFNYRLSDVAAALGVAQVERLDTLLAERERVARLYRERLAGIEGVVLPCEDRGAGAPQLVRIRGAGAGRGRPGQGDRRAGARRASPRRHTCRASTSSRCTASGSGSGAGSSRSPSGWRARSLALPFFTAMGEAGGGPGRRGTARRRSAGRPTGRRSLVVYSP